MHMNNGPWIVDRGQRMGFTLISPNVRAWVWAVAPESRTSRAAEIYASLARVWHVSAANVPQLKLNQHHLEVRDERESIRESHTKDSQWRSRIMLQSSRLMNLYFWFHWELWACECRQKVNPSTEISLQPDPAVVHSVHIKHDVKRDKIAFDLHRLMNNAHELHRREPAEMMSDARARKTWKNWSQRRWKKVAFRIYLLDTGRAGGKTGRCVGIRYSIINYYFIDIDRVLVTFSLRTRTSDMSINVCLCRLPLPATVAGSRCNSTFYSSSKEREVFGEQKRALFICWMLALRGRRRCLSMALMRSRYGTNERRRRRFVVT